jgi:hypothetical protein
MSIKAMLAAIAIPVLVQIACLLVLSSIDPCKNNTGCMAGSITGYALILVMPASVLVLIVATIIEWASGRIGGRAALKINVSLALLPFALIFGLLYFSN